MSLLNDALRKKEGEPQKVISSNIISKAAIERGTGGRKNVILIIIAFLILGIAVMFVWGQFSSHEVQMNSVKSDLSKADVQTQKEAGHGSIPQHQVAEADFDHEMDQLETEHFDIINKNVNASDIEKSEHKPAIAKALKPEPPVIKKNKITEKKIPKTKRRQSNLRPKKKPVPDDGITRTFYRKALVFHAENQLDQAERMYLQVLQKNPDHFAANFNLSAVYLQRGQYMKAFTLLEKCKYLDPDDSRVMINIAIAAIGMGNPENALTFLEQAENYKIKPSFEINFHKGVAYSHLGDFQKALSWYKKAEKIDPYNLKLLFNMGLVFDSLKQYPEALKYYNTCLAQSEKLSVEESNQITDRVSVIRQFATENSDSSVNKNEANL